MADRLVGTVVLAMALMLMLPIPFGNFGPAATIVLVSLGLAERDGLWVGVGALVAAASLGMAAGLVATVGFAANRWFG